MFKVQLVKRDGTKFAGPKEFRDMLEAERFAIRFTRGVIGTATITDEETHVKTITAGQAFFTVFALGSGYETSKQIIVLETYSESLAEKVSDNLNKLPSVFAWVKTQLRA